MRIVNSGDRFIIYSNVLNTYDNLPAQYYDIDFNKMTGYSLVMRAPLEVKETKIYGGLTEKADKVLEGYSTSNRNFGVIISGESGMGKSILMRLICIKAIENNIPVITCSEYTPGLTDFLASIDQRVVVIFDEFEKKFAEDRETGFDPQADFLSLLDGVDGGNKLYIITCNKTHMLNDYMLNRPGRFYYHFRLTKPDADSVEEYLNDHLTVDNKENLIQQILSLDTFYPFTYDNLRALAIELNKGYDIGSSLNDLNIEFSQPSKFKAVVYYENGKKDTVDNYTIDWYRPQSRLFLDSGNNLYNGECCLGFSIANIKYDKNGKFFFLDKVDKLYEDDYGDVTPIREEDVMTSVKQIQFIIKPENEFLPYANLISMMA